MHRDQRFTEAIRLIDAANSEDPVTETVGGESQPRELLFARRVYEWIERLVFQPSQALLLAARGHTVRRWHIPRSRYPMDTVGYHQWRNELAEFHAGETGKILQDLGYPATLADRVKSLITREDWRNDPEGQALEDADCLAFLQLKLDKYRNEWGEEKTVRILRSTLRKMSPSALEAAKTLDMDAGTRDLLTKASI